MFTVELFPTLICLELNPAGIDADSGNPRTGLVSEEGDRCRTGHYMVAGLWVAADSRGYFGRDGGHGVLLVVMATTGTVMVRGDLPGSNVGCGIVPLLAGLGEDRDVRADVAIPPTVWRVDGFESFAGRRVVEEWTVLVISRVARRRPSSDASSA